MIEPPPDVLSQSKLAFWLRKLRQSVRSNQIINGPGIRVTKAPWGCIVSADGDGGGKVRARMYKLKSVQGDYVTCHTWDGETEGEDDIYLAKSPKLRKSLTEENKLGTVHTYTYGPGPADNTENIYRYDTLGTQVERQLVIPVWVPDEIVYGIDADATGVTLEIGGVPAGMEKVTKLLISPSRQWAKA